MKNQRRKSWKAVGPGPENNRPLYHGGEELPDVAQGETAGYSHWHAIYRPPPEQGV